MLTFSDVEKLRAATKIVRFKTANPAATVEETIHAAFIKTEAPRIDAEQKAVWPGVKKVEHWSGLNLADRVRLLKSAFDEIYEVEYPRLSWYAHSGLTGFVNLQAATFNTLAANQNKLAGEAFVSMLDAVIDEFEISAADPKIKGKLKLAKLLPFTDTPEEGDSMARALLS